MDDDNQGIAVITQRVLDATDALRLLSDCLGNEFEATKALKRSQYTSKTRYQHTRAGGSVKVQVITSSVAAAVDHRVSYESLLQSSAVFCSSEEQQMSDGLG